MLPPRHFSDRRQAIPRLGTSSRCLGPPVPVALPSLGGPERLLSSHPQLPEDALDCLAPGIFGTKFTVTQHT